MVLRVAYDPVVANETGDQVCWGASGKVFQILERHRDETLLPDLKPEVEA